MRRHRDLELTAAAAVLCAIVALLVRWEPLRVLATVPLALALPGYAIAALSFAASRPPRAQLALASLGCGLAALALGALVLNYVPGGIRAGSWALLLVAVVLLACRAAAVRRPGASGSGRRPRIRLKRLDLALLVGGAVAVVVAVVLAQSTLPAKNAIGFTALWMLPSQAREGEVRVGVSSDEHQGTLYLLRVGSVGGARSTSRFFRLKPGEERTFGVAVPGPPAGGRHKAMALLYRASQPDVPYRRTTVWIDG